MKTGIYVSVPSLLDLEETKELLSHFDEVFIYVDRSNGDQLLSPSEYFKYADQYSMYPHYHPVVWPKEGELDRATTSRYMAYGWTGPRLNLEHNELKSNPVEEEWMRFFGRSVTTHQGHPELVRSKSKVFRWVGGEVQAYSTRTAQQKWGAQFLPGACQERGFAKGLACSGEAPQLALPLWAQTGIPGFKDPIDAMATAYEAAKGLGCPQVNYWDLKFLVGKNAISYAREFVLQVLPQLQGGGL